MKLSSALLWLTSSVLGVRPSYGEPKYFEVGKTLTLEPDVSTVKQPVSSIRWKYGPSLVVDWDRSGLVYYGLFKGRTTLDPQTLRLDINRLTLADNGQFSLETNLGTVMTHEVKVVKPPPKPHVTTTKNSEGAPALRCTADTQDLGPVTYEWKKEEFMKSEWKEGNWTEGKELKGMNSSDTPEKFSCRLMTRVNTSEASDPVRNPTEPLPKPHVTTTKNSEGAPALRCTADTQDLGPVTYEWKKDEFMKSEWKEGNWTKGDQLMVMTPKTCDKFSCRLITPVRHSEASDRSLNPLCEPEPLPKPSVTETKNSQALRCTADTQDLGPVTYEWKKYEEKEHKLIKGPWTEGDVLKSMNGSKTCEAFSCRLVTLLGPSDASGLMGNPLCPDYHIWWKVLLGITVPLGAVGAGLTTMVYKRPDHPFSKRLKSSIPWIKKADGASEASTGRTAGHTNAVSLLPSSPVAGDSELGK